MAFETVLSGDVVPEKALAGRTREEWLIRATDWLAGGVFKAAGVTIERDKVRVTCGWPSSKGTSARKKAIGECWPRSRSEAGVNEIFISPVLADGVRVLDVLVHELVHAVDDCNSGHGSAFRSIAKKVGLQAPWTATTAGPELLEQLQQVLDVLGPYPHSTLNGTRLTKVKQTFLKKAKCEDCGATIRITQTWVDAAGGELRCPCCDSDNPMTVES